MTALLVAEERLTVQEVADLCGVSVHSVRRWIYRGIGPHRLRQRKLAGRSWVLRSDLDAFVAKFEQTELEAA